MSVDKPYRAVATGVGTFQIEGPGLEGCAPIYDVEADAARCALGMNNAWTASRRLAVKYIEARAAHFRKYSVDLDLSVDGRARCSVQAQCLYALAAEVERGDTMP